LLLQCIIISGIRQFSIFAAYLGLLGAILDKSFTVSLQQIQMNPILSKLYPILDNSPSPKTLHIPNIY
ncbi:MAG: hypothetical protein Q4G60_11350, partial [bacterium]|nr:hypothetical protein [bacterium]